MRISFNGTCVAAVTVVYSVPIMDFLSDFIRDPTYKSAVPVLVAVILAALTVNLIDWAIWKENRKARNELNNALRKWEMFSGKVVGEASPKREARWWWWPLRKWWLKRKYGDK